MYWIPRVSSPGDLFLFLLCPSANCSSRRRKRRRRRSGDTSKSGCSRVGQRDVAATLVMMTVTTILMLNTMLKTILTTTLKTILMTTMATKKKAATAVVTTSTWKT